MSEHMIPAPESSRSTLEGVWNHTLPESVIPLIDEYETVVGDRDRFLWKWAHYLFPEFRLSTVPPEESRVRDQKLIGLVFVSLLDDIAEKHGDWATFQEAAKIPFDHQTANYDRPEVDVESLSFIENVWDRFASAVRDGPRADKFEEVFLFDLKQILNAIHYSYVANQDIAFINGSELQNYDAHNMMLYVFADVDLIHSPSSDRGELASLRRVVDHSQRMVRIGNWITTWERELHEGDFTSGVVVHALENDIVTVDTLQSLDETTDQAAVDTVVESIKGHDVEHTFLRQWHEELSVARTFEGTIDSVDVGAYLDGIETVMDYHLASRGLK